MGYSYDNYCCFRFLFLISGCIRCTDVVLTGYTVSADGRTLMMKVQRTDSLGYIRSYGIKQEKQNQYLTFYSTFGGFHRTVGAKSEFQIQLDPDCREIYFYHGTQGYSKVLRKNEETNRWERVS